MKKILTLLAVFAVLMGSAFAETIGDNPDDPFERERFEKEKLTTQTSTMDLNEVGLSANEIDKNAVVRIEYQPMHDELHKAPPGSKILDVDVYINFDYLKKLDPTDSVYEQLLKIYSDHQYYYDEVIRCYQEYVQQGLEISEDFNTLVLRCMELTCNRKYSKKNIKLCDPREPIEFITVQITYSYEREISLGSKLTGREGKLHSPTIERSVA